jgi:hypothetical protein
MYKLPLRINFSFSSLIVLRMELIDKVFVSMFNLESLIKSFIERYNPFLFGVNFVGESINIIQLNY